MERLAVALLAGSILLGLSSCGASARQAELETENARLQSSLDDSTREFSQAKAHNEKLDAAFKEAIGKYRKETQKTAELNKEIVELRKQLSASQHGGGGQQTRPMK